MAEIKPKIGIYTSGIIRNEEGNFLLTRHIHIGDPVWLMPGGKPDHGETAEECLVRELREELAMCVQRCTFFGSYLTKRNDQEWVGLFFNVNEYSGVPTIQEPQKHSALEWMSAGRMMEVVAPQPEMGIAQYLEEIRSLCPNPICNCGADPEHKFSWVKHVKG